MSKFIVIENFFSEINSELKSYMLGYFLADGYISIEEGRPRFGLNSSIDDVETIELFSKSLFIEERKLEIRDRQSIGVKHRKQQVGLRWTSKKMFEDFKQLNINPNKTKDTNFEFNFDLIPKELTRHFIRGFFDGDGCVSLNKQHCFDWSFIFTSETFCKQIAKILEYELYGLHQNIYSYKGKNMLTYMLRFNSNRMKTFYSKLFYDYLYYNSNFYLKRKKKKFEDFFEYRGILEWALDTQVTVERRS